MTVKPPPAQSWVAAAALAELYIMQRKLGEAQNVIHRVLTSQNVGARATAWVLLFAARYALVDDLHRLRSKIDPWAARQRTARGTAFLALIDSYLARTQGNTNEAKRQAEIAAAGFAEERSPIFEALGAELAGRRRDAVELYRRAGAFGEVVRLDAEFTPRGRRDRHSVELSEREREVAELVGEGKANKAIAAALGISERTVENHLTSIFKKTGVASRAELIARSARTGSFGFSVSRGDVEE